MKQLPNTPPKGTSDWFPEEFKVRKYIFDTWRKVCQSYGFEEYLGPLVENIDIWKAKSGEDVGGSELTRITNREGELSDLAIRPEMTPTVTRMVSRIWKETDKPVKWFSIANYYRNEKPQKGRNREFWQLNADIFGEESLRADIETLTLALDLMRAFNPPKGSYKLKLNHRELINGFFKVVLDIEEGELQTSLMRLLDKYEKLPKEVFETELEKLGITDAQVVHNFMTAKNLGELKERFISLAGDTSFQDFEEIFNSLEALGYGEEIEFSGNLIRGFDYYDGVIFEMFDTNKDNSRALFGGGRYNGLADIFGVKQGIPAVGFAPGDETMKLFLEGHGLLNGLINNYKDAFYFPKNNGIEYLQYNKISIQLRKGIRKKKVYTTYDDKKISKALNYARKKKFRGVILYGYNRDELYWELKKFFINTDLYLLNNLLEDNKILIFDFKLLKLDLFKIKNFNIIFEKNIYK